ncbi:hypothetical protein HAX54_044242 [Datura stramonium]|uniref:Uncharacterized protein n=1 Tax=Datura stramonium TaxID=4076 RepID=A0ABS8W4A7_DATST|nr:hypothetical protein [Datura stramonium]
MSITDSEDEVLITGRYLMYFTANGLPMYGETSISDDESLSLFLRSPDIFCIKSNIMGQMPYNNYVWSMHNCEIGGPSSVATHMKSFALSTDQPAQPYEANFGRGNIIQQVSCTLQSIDRCNNVVEILIQLTEIVNNNDLAVVQQDASDK